MPDIRDKKLSELEIITKRWANVEKENRNKTLSDLELITELWGDGMFVKCNPAYLAGYRDAYFAFEPIIKEIVTGLGEWTEDESLAL